MPRNAVKPASVAVSSSAALGRVNYVSMNEPCNSHYAMQMTSQTPSDLHLYLMLALQNIRRKSKSMIVYQNVRFSLKKMLKKYEKSGGITGVGLWQSG